MIMTVSELKQIVPTTESDELLTRRLKSIEHLIRIYTHNNFQKRSIRSVGEIRDGVLYCVTDYLKNGETIEISESEFNSGLYVIANMTEGEIPFAEGFDESGVLVTKVEYPEDIKTGAANMIRWDLGNRNKVGIQSETISRHSVTYFNMDGDNSMMGYPKSLLGFLKPYMKARF